MIDATFLKHPPDGSEGDGTDFGMFFFILNQCFIEHPIGDFNIFILTSFLRIILRRSVGSAPLRCLILSRSAVNS